MNNAFPEATQNELAVTKKSLGLGSEWKQRKFGPRAGVVRPSPRPGSNRDACGHLKLWHINIHIHYNGFLSSPLA